MPENACFSLLFWGCDDGAGAGVVDRGVGEILVR